MEKNKAVREQLNILYGCRCMLTGLKQTKLSYHHIEKREDHGKTTIDNGANLITDIHQWLHTVIEQQDYELFELVNECLKLYKKCIDLDMKELKEEYERECMPIYREAYEKYKKKK